MDIINAISTVVIAIFAGVQLWQIREQRRREIRAAYNTLMVEYSRMYAVAEYWASTDLVNLVETGLFDPDDLGPRDWGAIATLLGALGSVAADQGGVAYVAASQAMLGARHLKQEVREKYNLPFSADPVGARKTAARYDERIETAQDMIRVSAREAAKGLKQAMLSAPKWAQRGPRGVDWLAYWIRMRMFGLLPRGRSIVGGEREAEAP